MDLLAVWLGKLTLTALRLLGRRGNALPGLVVEKAFPRFLARAMARLPEGVVVVTGTNGKTTTTKMVATLLAQDYRVLTNDTGSNFVRGAITATVEHADWTHASIVAVVEPPPANEPIPPPAPPIRKNLSCPVRTNCLTAARVGTAPSR